MKKDRVSVKCLTNDYLIIKIIAGKLGHSFQSMLDIIHKDGIRRIQESGIVLNTKIEDEDINKYLTEKETEDWKNEKQINDLVLLISVKLKEGRPEYEAYKINFLTRNPGSRREFLIADTQAKREFFELNKAV